MYFVDARIVDQQLRNQSITSTEHYSLATFYSKHAQKF